MRAPREGIEFHGGNSMSFQKLRAFPCPTARGGEIDPRNDVLQRDGIQMNTGLGRFPRIAMNILLPPAMATGIFMAFGWLMVACSQSSHKDGLEVGMALLVLFFAYIFATLSAILHAVGMEYCYRKAPPGNRKALVWSIASGGIAGILVYAIVEGISLLDGARPDWLNWLGPLGFFTVWGAATGLVTGAIIFMVDRAARKRAQR